jgi:hypothetical protein
MSINDAQQYHLNTVHFLRKEITYADNGETISLGWVPAGASVIRGGVNVNTVFNGDTTNTLDLGYRNGGNSETDDTDEFATDLALGTAGVIVADEMATAGVTTFANGAEIVGVVTSTASASTGAGVMWIEYIVDNT